MIKTLYQILETLFALFLTLLVPTTILRSLDNDNKQRVSDIILDGVTTQSVLGAVDGLEENKASILLSNVTYTMIISYMILYILFMLFFIYKINKTQKEACL